MEASTTNETKSTDERAFRATLKSPILREAYGLQGGITLRATLEEARDYAKDGMRLTAKMLVEHSDLLAVVDAGCILDERDLAKLAESLRNVRELFRAIGSDVNAVLKTAAVKDREAATPAPESATRLKAAATSRAARAGGAR